MKVKIFWPKTLLVFGLIWWGLVLQALGQGGTVIAWGYGADGETNIPPGLTNVIAISSGGDHGMALKADLTIADWGLEATAVPSLTNVVAIAAGGDPNSLALLANGSLVAWGGNDDNVSAIPPGLTNVVAIAAGYIHSVAIKSDGTVVAWGDNSSGQTNVPPGLSNVVAVSAGEFHSLALKDDGTVVGWGDNTFGESTAPVELSNVVAIAAGTEQFSVALKSDGTVQAWGFPAGGETSPPSGLNGVIAVAAGNNYGLALKNDGTIVPWGFAGYGATNVPAAASNAIAIAAFGYLSMAVVADGSPHIARQPFKQFRYSGSTAIFSAGAVGKPPLNYQWQFNGTNILNATNAQLSWTNVQTGDSGFYSVIVSNSQGTIASSNSVLTVTNSSPVFTVQPTNQTCALGLNASFLTSVVGSVPLSYQWQFNQSNIIGATNANLTLTNIELANQGNYELVVSNSYGTAISSNVVLTPVPFVVSALPVSQSVPAGNTVGFSVSLSAAPPINYQWQFNSENIPGATNSSLVLTDVQSGSAGAYTVLVSNFYGTTNWTATLAVNSSAPVLSRNPISQTTVIGGFANFQVTAQGSEPLSYQWQFNSTNIPGATDALLSVTNAQSTNQGIYRAVVTNLYGPATSSNASLTVTSVSLGQALNATNLTWTLGGTTSWFPETSQTHDGLAVQSGPVSFGQDSLLQTTVTGPATLTVWWRSTGPFDALTLYVNGSFQGVPLSGGLWSMGGPFYLGAGLQNLTWQFYDALVSGNPGAAYVDQVTVVPGGTAATISQSPANQTVRAGAKVTLQVNAFGTPPLIYQWQFNSNNIPGATNFAFTLANVQSANAGSYSVIVTNAFGAAQSSNATLTVQQPFFGTSPGSASFGNQGFTLQLNGLTGHGIVTIYSSTNLVNWQPVFTNPPVVGSLQFIDPNALNVPFQFYRASEQ